MGLDYLVMGWTGYGLIAAGLAFMLPVVISIGRHQKTPLPPHPRHPHKRGGPLLPPLLRGPLRGAHRQTRPSAT